MSQICGACNKPFKSARTLQNHLKICKNISSQKIESLESDVLQLKEKTQLEVCALHEKYRLQAIALDKKYQTELFNLNEKHQLQISQITSLNADNHSRIISLQAEINSLNEKLRLEITSVSEKYQTYISNLKEKQRLQLQAETTGLNEKHQIHIFSLEEKYQSKITGLKENMAILTMENDDLQKEIIDLKHQLQIQGLQKDLSFAEKIIEDKEKRIEKEAQDIREFKHHLFEQSSKARYTTINNLAPFTLTAERASEIAKLYTVEDFQRGPEATLEFIAEKQLKDASGKPMVVCTDESRLVFRGNDINGEPFLDIGGSKIVGLIRNPMRQAVTGVYNDLIGTTQESEHEPTENKWKSHRRALEPKRLTKALAGKTKKR